MTTRTASRRPTRRKPRRRKRRLSAKRAELRRERRIRITVIAGSAGLVLVLALAVFAALRPGAPVPALQPQAVTVQPDQVGGLTVGGWDAEQVRNAAVIVQAGNDLGLGARDQAIAVMTAMGESSLRSLDYGDFERSGVRNPDGSPTTSIGLFQQQDSWGDRSSRMDPYRSAVLFYRAMLGAVPERADVAPTIVAHRTQRNRDAQHYASRWSDAVTVVEALRAAG